jgi:hypothetical protein
VKAEVTKTSEASTQVVKATHALETTPTSVIGENFTQVLKTINVTETTSENANSTGTSTANPLGNILSRKGSATQIQSFQPSGELPTTLQKNPLSRQESTTRTQTFYPSPVKILAPTPNDVVDVPATTVVVQFPIGSKVELRVNETLVDSTLIGRAELNSSINKVTLYLAPGNSNVNSMTKC